jgi:hypothetical protein
MFRSIGRIAAFGLVAAAVAGCGGYGQGKGEGSGDGVQNRIIPRPGGDTGPITRDDTNAGTSGTGRGDVGSPTSGPRHASDVNSRVTK